MSDDDPVDSLDAFIELVQAAEDLYPYVSLERLRRLARRQPGWRALSPFLARRVREAVVSGLLFTDSRLRLTRSGTLEPIRIYRLNRRHARVTQG